TRRDPPVGFEATGHCPRRPLRCLLGCLLGRLLRFLLRCLLPYHQPCLPTSPRPCPRLRALRTPRGTTTGSRLDLANPPAHALAACSTLQQGRHPQQCTQCDRADNPDRLERRCRRPSVHPPSQRPAQLSAPGRSPPDPRPEHLC